MKNLEPRQGFKNRHTDGLPDTVCLIWIIKKDSEGEHIYLCEWEPFDKSQYTEINMPSNGYLGTATIMTGRYHGTGFHAWEQNNSQFIYYQIQPLNFKL